MLKVLILYTETHTVEAGVPLAAGMLPDYFDYEFIHLESTNELSRDQIIGSDLVLFLSYPGSEKLRKEVTGLCRRLYTPVTVMGENLAPDDTADYTVLLRDGKAFRDFITDFRAGHAAPVYPPGI
ncbi:MAG: hypothetical protein JW760_00395 [Spirochaetales bacterium]|nr:hypothetical protein [Spirochaetales bacterium]